MKQFTDDEGDVWTLKGDVNAFERIRDLAKIDLTGLLDDQDVIAQFTSSNAKLVEVLLAWLQPQIEERKLAPEDFGGRLYESLSDAFDAILGELPSFFPPHRRRLVKEIVQSFLDGETKGQERATKVLHSDRMQQTIDQALDAAEEQAFDHVAARIGGRKSTS